MIALYIFLGFIAFVLIVAAMAGTGWKYEKTIRIHAAPDKVWGHVNSLGAINTWNPWIDRDPNLRQTMTGVDGTPGATYSWESEQKNVGAGSQTIVAVTPPSEFATRIDFLKPFKGTAQAYVRVAGDGGATLATWGIVSSTPYPMNIVKVFGLIEKNMNRDFEKGLNKLKDLCEK
jgi:hypothetical protein